MAYIKWEDLLEATNKGLDIITMYYPDAPNALQRTNKKFRVSDADKTASSSIRLKKGYYHVTHFNGDAKERNAIQICELETGKSFAEAIQYLAALFKVDGSSVDFVEVKPIIDRRPIKADEKPGDYHEDFKDFSESDLAQIGPCVSEEHCQDYNLHSLKAFTYIKKGGNEAVTSTATEAYPIFTFHHENWSKLYQPLSYDKAFRFRFLGKKPKRFIYGESLVKKLYEKNKEKIARDYDSEDKDKDTDPRLERIFIVSGGSDGLNLRSFGHVAIWFNSESEMLNFEEYKRFMQWTKEIIYVPDLDSTGIKQSVKIALDFLDIKIMMLPSYLKFKKDKRGNPCKDFKDFVVNYYDPKKSRSFHNKLDKLIENAMPARFWDVIKQKKQLKFIFRNTQFYNFLRLNGFGRIKDEHTKDGYHYVHIQGNVVKKVLPVEIEHFVHNFLQVRELPLGLRDLIYQRNLSETSLKKLAAFNIDFRTATSNLQYMFFDNGVMEITPKEIKLKKRGDIDQYIWERKLLKHTVHIEKPHFTITKDLHGNDDIIIHEQDNMFLNYMINTCRIHWRKELETSLEGIKQPDAEQYKKDNKFNIAGPNLEPEERQEQKLHLINKIYAFGYMMHTYKSPDKPFALYAMDNKVADINESHGGSGKSVFLKGIQRVLLENHYINGRDSRKTQDDFIYHGVTNETDFIMVDDCHAYMDYGFFFNAITGDLDVNNKNGLRFVIPFDDVGKIGFASNYPPNSLDPSLARRLLFTVFSDYYHHNQDDEYNESRAISDDFEGKTLFKHFTDAQWNKFYNFCAQCIQFYLSSPYKIDPPMENVTMRNLMQEMGVTFKDWADVFFAKKVEDQQTSSPAFKHLDVYLVKQDAWEDFQKTKSKMSPTKFKKCVKAYCKYNEWIFNPKEYQTEKNGRILKTIDNETKEVFYIKTTNSKKVEVQKAAASEPIKDDNHDDLPF